MIRRVAAVIIALTLYPALLHAQDTVLTVTVPSADVYKGPSTVTPVVGHVTRGTVLPVSRNLGSWAKVAWPDAPEGVAYVHVTMGRLGTGSTDTPAAAPAPQPPPPAPAPATVAPRPRPVGAERIVVRGQQDDTPISHIVGIGGVVGSMSSVGGTARAWRNNRFGIQLGLTRDAMTSGAGARVTSVQLEPGLMYALFDHVSDYVWVRPYVGAGMSFHHQTLKLSASPEIGAASENGIGFRVFGGSELTFAGITRLGLSVEVGYRHAPAPFSGFEPRHAGLSIAGHWYVR